MKPALRAVLLAICCVSLGACSRPLPERGSADAALYAARCGSSCHAAYQPHSMTPTMWKLQVDRMDQKYRAAGIPLPTPAERDRILQYLTRNAGG